MRLSEYNVFMLLTDGFGGLGGISQFNRDFLTALDRSSIVTRTMALPRLISSAIAEKVPESVVYLHKAARSKFDYLGQLIRTLHLCTSIDLVVCGHIHLLPFAHLAAKLKRARLALVIHGIEAWQPCSHTLANKIAGKVDAVVAVSKLTSDRFQRWSGVPAQRTFILGNCVDLDRFVPMPRDQVLAARYGLERPPVIMTLARLSQSDRYKGVDEVMEAMPSLLEEVPDLKYFVVGDGGDRPRLQAKAASLKLGQHVVFAHQVPECEKVAHYSLANAFVMPSSGEGFGIVLLEAAACGLAVIGSAIDGSREALLGGTLGQLIDPHNRQALKHAILGAVTKSETKCRPQNLETYAVPAFQRKVNGWLNAQASESIEVAV